MADALGRETSPARFPRRIVAMTLGQLVLLSPEKFLQFRGMY